MFYIILFYIIFTPCSAFAKLQSKQSIQKEKHEIIKIAIPLLVRLEGFTEKRYWDNNGYAIGYGDHDLAEKYKTVTKEQALSALNLKAYNLLHFINQNKLNHLSKYQKAALISYTYNRGKTRLLQSELYQELIKPKIAQNNAKIHKLFIKNIYTKYSKELVARRKREYNVFITIDKSVIIKPKPIREKLIDVTHLFPQDLP